MKKILIIGFGNMGLSHFKSFIKKSYIIHIVEKKINKQILELKKNNLFNKSIFVFRKIPTKQKYLLTIFATPSKERFPLVKKFLINNQSKYLLLEKFCFFSISQLDEFKDEFNKQTKAFINSWGYLIAKKSGLKSKLKNFKVICNIKEGNLLANITHLFHFFNYLNKKSSIKDLLHNNTKVIKNIKRPSYDELRTTLHLQDNKENTLKIETKKKMNNLITFNILQKSPKVNFKITIGNDNSIHFYNSGLKKNKIQFPFSSKTTFVFLQYLMKNNSKFMPSFKDDYKFSKILLKKLNVKIP